LELVPDRYRISVWGMKSVWRWMVVIATEYMNLLFNATELHT
jgi:hypothetical protein